jgi:hypothetical protein
LGLKFTTDASITSMPNDKTPIAANIQMAAKKNRSPKMRIQ